ncbi:MAG TPA: MEDS domain-containing protein [Rhodothermales bacterium]|nr:MEDS domain-containing protein [Rhodothermales bacterium]
MEIKTTDTTGSRQVNGPEIFWGEITPCEHLVQIYEDDGVFLDALEGFAAAGIKDGDAVVILATPVHLKGLEDRLRACGVDVDLAHSQGQYVPLDAEETLSKFMIEEWPDEDRFRQVITDLIARARSNGRQVRVFGELVAILWAQGRNGATVRLEHLWHALCESEAFPLFCAYPRIGFTQDASASIREICETHSRVIGESGFMEFPDANAA